MIAKILKIYNTLYFSELELEKEEEREREAQLILDFSDYLDSKFQNGDIPAHLYRGLKGRTP